tara:strand:- start:50 stop:904 length:855 start_codon:yes stop_codon:yes gene_type:complete
MKKIKIGIIGHGFVGKATDYGFNKSVEKKIIDPCYGNDIDDLMDFDPTVIFVCVPTPMGDDGSQDTSILRKVVNELSLKFKESVIVIKSTVLPKVLTELHDNNKNIVYNPEFLREKHANEDFVNSPLLILGGNKNPTKVISDAYKNHSVCLNAEHIFMDIHSASIIKYAINTFLATKVIFFNELYELFNTTDSNDDWKKIIDTISKDSRIGNSHMMVPGHDGKYGFGGACFPKDSVALAKFASEQGVTLSLLEQAIKKNNKIRSQYDTKDKREIAQNVSFDDKI